MIILVSFLHLQKIGVPISIKISSRGSLRLRTTGLNSAKIYKKNIITIVITTIRIISEMTNIFDKVLVLDPLF